MSAASGMTGALDAGLLDVELPAPEALAVTSLLPWLGLVALLLLTAWLLWWWRFSPRGLARHRLQRLERVARAGRLPPRGVALHLAQALRLGLGLPRLSLQCAPSALPAGQVTRWRDFLVALETARFAPDGCSADAARALILEARYWLRRWPRRPA